MKPVYLSLLLLLSVALSLITNNYFGPPSFAAYFFSALAMMVLSAFLGVGLLINHRLPVRITLPVKLMLVMGAFTLLHGLCIHVIGQSQYYWIGLVLMYAAINIWVNQERDANRATGIQQILYNGIVVLALLESLVVIFQLFHIVPSAARYFSVSGTYANPNVTAMFLALSLFGVLQKEKHASVKWGRIFAWMVLGLTLLSIIILKSRTAYIASIILIGGMYIKSIITFFKERMRWSKRQAIWSIGIFFAIAAVTSILLVKNGSSNSRLHIWQNCFSMMSHQSIFGAGFGLFESKYNLFAARVPDAANTYVRSAFNDYLELYIEGGIIAVGCWIFFMAVLFKYAWQNNREFIPLLLAVAVMQCSNFVIQAIPVMLLFIGYISTVFYMPVQKNTAAGMRIKLIVVAVVLILASGWTFVHQYRQAGAYRQLAVMKRSSVTDAKVEPYLKLLPLLVNEPLFNEALADALFGNQQYDKALNRYLFALRTSGNPSLFMKAGDCFMEKQLYPRSEQCYTIASFIDPARFTPLYSLLRLYETQGDMKKANRIAMQIMSKPVKVPGADIDKIKIYASEFIQSHQLMTE